MSRRTIVISVGLVALFIGTPLVMSLSGQQVGEAMYSNQSISYIALLVASGLTSVFLPIQCLLLPLLALILIIFGLYSLRHKRGKPLLFGVLAVVATFVSCRSIGSSYWGSSVSDQGSVTVGSDLYRLALIKDGNWDIPMNACIVFRCVNQGDMCVQVSRSDSIYLPEQPYMLTVDQNGEEVKIGVISRNGSTVPLHTFKP
ncbi:MAG: hypothetical protein JNM70_21055 [Anaerolineae bacterium]|nr:hypothetical protein [Anaerolineae bacterium]